MLATGRAVAHNVGFPPAAVVGPVAHDLLAYEAALHVVQHMPQGWQAPLHHRKFALIIMILAMRHEHSYAPSASLCNHTYTLLPLTSLAALHIHVHKPTCYRNTSDSKGS